ncbi:MAG: hypothetical protein N4Q30_02500 [Neisseriaceae bacterium]|nr:hypothetical protein [Neisseriaceae bacterium]
MNTEIKNTPSTVRYWLAIAIIFIVILRAIAHFYYGISADKYTYYLVFLIASLIAFLGYVYTILAYKKGWSSKWYETINIISLVAFTISVIIDFFVLTSLNM